MSAQAQPRLSPEQYLELERVAEFRHEYYDGRMYAMPGGTFPHVVVIGNVAYGLRNGLGKRPYIVATSDMRVRASPKGLYTYPDIAVVCGPPKLLDGHKDPLLNPILIVEVLSPGTEAYDRGFKFAQYRTLESLQEYALVSQSEPRVEVFRRQASGDWLLSEAVGLQAVCRFESVDSSVTLFDVYANITFGDDEAVGR